MLTNHLIVGLGGTGGKIIRAMRKRIYQEFRKENPENISIGYLYVDSSPEMMGLDDPTWKILGTSVQLGKASQLLIKGSNLKDVMDNIEMYPGIRPWIGDRNEWQDIFNSIMGDALGGQKRRLGRFLFATNVDKFNTQLQERAKALQEAAKISDITFHVCCGVAGGTGSGILIDTLCQIRSLYPDPRKYHILAYTLLPDTHPPRGWDTGNYHANGYANLMELNALSVGKYMPYDVTGKKQRLSLSDPFNGCYIFTNENENGMIVDVGNELPGIVADFLYQKIMDGNNWDTLRRMENAENGDGSPETEPGTKIPARSKRFLTFGIKRLVIPEEEILEYLTYDFASQASLQLLYNNWQEGLGFFNESKSQDFNEYVRQKEVLERWKITDDHLCLSYGILSEDISNKKWKSIQNEWQDVMVNFKLIIRESDKKTWLDELGKVCGKRFVEDFRGVGVKIFYNTKLKAKRDIAKELRKKIELELFDELRNGVKSINDITRLIDAIISYNAERLNIIDDKMMKLKNQEQVIQEKVNANYNEWTRVGFIRSAFGKHDKIFDSQAISLCDLYMARTWIEAWAFGKPLLSEFISEMTDLKSEVDMAAKTLKEAIEKFEDSLSERCSDEGTLNMKKHIIRFYQPKMVKETGAKLAKDDSVQKKQAHRVRAAISGKLGNNPSFKTFNERISTSVFIDLLENECEEEVRITHDNYIQNPKEKLLGVNIIEKLKEEYRGDPLALQAYVADLIKHAGNYLSFSSIEKQKRGLGLSSAQSAVSMFTVILPKTPEHSDFVSIFKDAIQKGHPGDKEILELPKKPNEIILVSITNLFPLRYLGILQFLKEKYEQRINGKDSSRAKLELHTEGDESLFPNLFVPSSGEVIKEGLPYFLIAKSMGMIMEGKNQTTGLSEVIMVKKDEYGFVSPVYLGKTITDVADNLDMEKAYFLKNEVDTKLKSGEYLHVDKREPIRKLIEAELLSLLNTYGFGDIYNRFLEGARKAAIILKGE
ncbi:MAG: tubulin-like doman-containing protein [Desulfobacterales bacterium]|nr:tubulin-like doman-containing protein [Desulfobacterales bacterium]MBF0396909.1 tubulin-like doman-containing protein [Desulfobacterales bacterium]